MVESTSMQDSSFKFIVLPPELITEILLRLPVKTLVKFKYVSKSWLALISSPEFVKTHLSISVNDEDNTCHRLIMTNNQPKYSLKECSLSSLLYDSVTEALDLEYPCKFTCKSVRVVGSVNGLVCLSVEKKYMFIWNPSIRKFKKLPDCTDTLCFGAYHFMYGFGYDEVRDDYKVVVGFSNNMSYRGVFLVKVKLYSLTSDSWTSIEDFHSGLISIDSGMFVNGKLHWANCNCSHPFNGWDIVSIDLADRKREKLEQPYYEEGYFYLMLGVLGSDLSVFYRRMHADVWVMKEYGVKESWIKMFTICLPSDTVGHHLCPFFCMSNKGKILFVFGSTFMIYNPNDNSIKYSKIVNYEAFYEANTYIESLVWPFLMEGTKDSTTEEEG